MLRTHSDCYQLLDCHWLLGGNDDPLTAMRPANYCPRGDRLDGCIEDVAVAEEIADEARPGPMIHAERRAHLLRAALVGLRDRVLESAKVAAQGSRLAIDRVFSVKGRGAVVTGVSLVLFSNQVVRSSR